MNVTLHRVIGWCASCKVGSHENDPNHCPSLGASGSAKKDKPAVVKWDKDWGFCKPNCQDLKNRAGLAVKAAATTLQEVRLTVLDAGNCSEILKKSNSSYSVDLELCAGKLNRKYKTKVLAVQGDGGTPEFVQVSAFNADEADTFIGGQDSCLGDSGGPLWKIFGAKVK